MCARAANLAALWRTLAEQMYNWFLFAAVRPKGAAHKLGHVVGQQSRMETAVRHKFLNGGTLTVDVGAEYVVSEAIGFHVVNKW